MTKATKAPAAKSWNDEVTAKAVEMYNGGEGQELDAIAKAIGKTVPAVRSKLVAEGVYVKKTPRAVGGASPVRKIALVKQLSNALGVDFDTIESLEKASKPALEALLDALNESAE